MSFFELPSRPPAEEEEHVGPPWAGEPSDRLGGPLPLALVVGRSARAAVVVQQALVYSEGMTLSVDAISPDEELLDAQFGLHRRRRDGLPAEFMRLGVEYADGTKATNLHDFGGRLDDAPKALLMRESGSGGRGRTTWRFWLWPLPKDNPFHFVCEWPGAQIPLTRTPLDVGLILAAAENSQALVFEATE